jgi:hypothetical protein
MSLDIMQIARIILDLRKGARPYLVIKKKSYTKSAMEPVVETGMILLAVPQEHATSELYRKAWDPGSSF